MQTDVLDEFLYADNMDKKASSEATIQRPMDQVSQSCDNYDLTIRVSCSPTSTWKSYNEPTITVNGRKLKDADKFTYMGSTLSRTVYIGNRYNETTITVNGRKLKVVDKFTYLGSTLSRAVNSDDEALPELQRQCVIRKTPCKCLTVKWNQAWHQVESLHGCGTANTLVCI